MTKMNQQIPINSYDTNINKQIPNYHQFHHETLRLLNAYGQPVNKWLDTGCGTGNIVFFAKEYFKDTQFYFADPDEEMLVQVQNKISDTNAVIFPPCSTDKINTDVTFDVITAIICHHYMDIQAKKLALEKCYSMLNKGGIYITFEHILSDTSTGFDIALKMMEDFHQTNGVSETERRKFADRIHKVLLIITVNDYMRILKEAGFSVVELFFRSHMQAGFYAIK